MKTVISVAGALVVVAAHAAAGATTGLISSNAVANGKLGGTTSGYATFLGADAQQEVIRWNPGFLRLVSPTRRAAVYFARKTGKAVVIVTWNPKDRTAAGVGPCTPISTLKRIYGSRLKPSETETYASGVRAYRVGNIIFGATGSPHPSTHVTGVGVFTDVVGNKERAAIATTFTLGDKAAC
jgi:hypothetical protein